MISSFDMAASAYDETFTNSVIGSLQRQFVYRHLSEILKKQPPKTILEINCGTGEDAIWLAKQQFSVTATDISEKMIGMAKNKEKLQNLDFHIADINKLPVQYEGYRFDMVFSNFGGLNCLSKTELGDFFTNASQLLSDKGQLVLVIMPKDTLWERLYFTLKTDFGNIFRRKKGGLTANVDGEKVPVFYYNPEETAILASAYFNVRQINPIGFFLPPSYLERFFKTKPGLVSVLQKMENAITNRAFPARYSDHYIIVLQKK